MILCSLISYLQDSISSQIQIQRGGKTTYAIILTMIYLNEDYEGGQTRFSNISIEPKTGTALIFLHSLEHEGSAVTSGVKYVLRSDIMYKLDEDDS